MEPDHDHSSPGALPGAASHRRKPRRKPRGVWGRRLLWTAGGLAVVVAGVALSGRMWLQRYLKSPEFTARLNDSAGRVLKAECGISGLSWQDSAAHADVLSAKGREAAAFRFLEISDVRAEVDAGALWDRVWKVNHIHVARVKADFSPGLRLPDDSGMAADTAAEGGTPETPGGWRQRWLPNRTEMGPVRVDRFDFVRTPGGTETAVQGRAFAVTVTPNLKQSSAAITATGGTVEAANARHSLEVRRVQLTARADGISMERMEGVLAKSTVSADGTLHPARTPALSLNLRLDDAALEDWLPEDWLRKCTGKAVIKVKIEGDHRQPATWDWSGDAALKDAVIQALPALDIIAKKTQNAAFLRMQIKESDARFHRRPDQSWQIRRLRADAPGLLRLKGEVDVSPAGELDGHLLLGIVPGTLRYIAGAEQSVFQTLDRAPLTGSEKASLTPEDSGLLWTRFRLTGTLESPQEDLSDRLARAWFDATVQEVQELSMEAAATAARTATGAADAVLKAAPPLLEKAPEIINQGVQGGLQLLDGLLPR